MLHDLKIGTRLTIAFLLMALFTLASGLVGLIGLNGATRASAVLSQDVEIIKRVQEIRVAGSQLMPPLQANSLPSDPAASRRFQVAVTSMRARLAEFDEARRFHEHPDAYIEEVSDLVVETEVEIDQLEVLGEQILETADRAARIALLTEMELRLVEVAEKLDDLLVKADQDIEQAEAAHRRAEQFAYVGLSVSAVLAITLALVLAFVTTRSISRPVAHLATVADDIAGGDLSHKVSVVGRGEIAQLASAFEQMRLSLLRERGQLRLLAVLEERDRIGREMHDGLAQVLGYVNTKAQAVREFLKAGELKQAEQQIEELVLAAREAYTDAREAIFGLRMDGAGRRSLTDLLAEYCRHFQRQSGVATCLTISHTWADERLSSKVQVQLLRIVQESLTNVRKHAGAGQVTIELKMSEGDALVLVQDDGRGFALSRLLQRGFTRFGLRTMRERAQAVGGSFRIESMPGQGTRIRVGVPLETAEREEI